MKVRFLVQFMAPHFSFVFVFCLVLFDWIFSTFLVFFSLSLATTFIPKLGFPDERTPIRVVRDDDVLQVCGELEAHKADVTTRFSRCYFQFFLLKIFFFFPFCRRLRDKAGALLLWLTGDLFWSNDEYSPDSWAAVDDTLVGVSLERLMKQQPTTTSIAIFPSLFTVCRQQPDRL